MAYKVIRYFTDLQDDNYAYHAGDAFPRNGIEVSEERIAELLGNNNKRHMPLIEKAADNPEPVKDPVKEEKPKSKRTKTRG